MRTLCTRHAEFCGSESKSKMCLKSWFQRLQNLPKSIEAMKHALQAGKFYIVRES